MSQFRRPIPFRDASMESYMRQMAQARLWAMEQVSKLEHAGYRFVDGRWVSPDGATEVWMDG